MIRALVTGAGGFIGSALAEELLARGYAVRAMTHRPHALPSGVESAAGDLTDPDSLRGVADDCTWVFNCAGYAHATDSDAGRHRAVNFQGVANLAKEARRAGVRTFVQFSSVKAQTPAADDAYGQAKLAAERALAASGLERIAILRPALVYGPGCKGNLARMFEAVRLRRLPPLPRVHNRRSLIDLRDLISVALLAAQDTPLGTSVYTVTDGRAYSTRDIQDEMYLALGRAPPRWGLPAWGLTALAAVSRRARGSVERLLGDAWYDSEPTVQRLGFRPRYQLSDGLRAMLRENQ
ncbi:MAG: NAD-dependent epimerase/dehydratase family protein [Chromatiales bacterium]|nr:NAD-dependent epimerase/dehydratase family protein [Chromatiales bacterium]